MKKNMIFALGFFDGVHLGHQALLAECVRLAEQMDAQTAAITFENHPQSLFRADVPPLLTTLADRVRLLGRYGMEEVIAYPVTEAVMGMHWEDFLRELLDRGAVGFVCGDDFRFGSRGEGNAEKLRQFCRARKLPCVIVPEQNLDGVRISSSYIRKQIAEGDMATAVRFLGHPHCLSQMVRHGQTFLNVHARSELAGRTHDDPDFTPVDQIETVLPLLVGLVIVDNGDLVFRDASGNQFTLDFRENIELDDPIFGKFVQIAENDLCSLDRIVIMIFFNDNH